ncbi:MAG: GTPase Era [Bacteroidales bacterium]|nr:GTPase Era [Bacteroidales bacterium]MBS3777400.1 GTPase Era [Bacteroidales bacterium]
MDNKAGFVNIIGNPNVGKSTLMNQLVGEKLSIITSKAQTTRHRIMGIISGENFQIIYSDTPGIIEPHYKLHEKMLRFIDLALEDADILLYVTDIREKYDKHLDYIEKIKKTDIPVILIVNKIDLARENELEPILSKWKKMLPHAHIIPVSALKGYYLPEVFDKILELLPENPPYYPKDALTDKPERFFVSEIIREKIFLNYEKEVPYSTEVQIEEFKDTDQILNIRATIYVMRDSQKAILIGSRGEAIKNIGIRAREELEAIYEKQVFLDLYVKVHKEWRDKDGFLKSRGYNV